MNIIKTNRRALQSGTTLVELSVVIAVILLIAGVTFVAIQGWRDAANKAACIVNLATLQKAVRGYYNVNTDSPAVITAGYSLPILHAAGFIGSDAGPTCPAANAGYAKQATLVNGWPDVGVQAFTCPNAPPHQPSAASLANW
jgi:type II secretory pathway pseudopilin PulG